MFDTFGLSREAYALLLALYSEFKNRRKLGESFSNAACFADPSDVKRFIGKLMSDDDIVDLVIELSDNGLADALFCDDSFDQVMLTRSAVERLDNRFLGDLQAVLKAMQAFLGFFPK